MTSADDCWILRAPRLNANDDAVTVTRWIVPNRTRVEAGQPVAETETEKATVEVSAQTGGMLVHAVATGAKIPIGAPLAAIGPTAVAAENALRDHIRPAPAVQANAQATPKAQALAARHGVDLAHVTATGGAIKERDVARHLAEQGGAASAVIDDPRFMLTGPASAHRLRVARDLRAAMQTGLFTVLAYRLDLRGPERAIAAELIRGRTASLLVMLLAALGKTLPQFPDLVSVIARDTVYRYRDVDIAFAARSPAGELQAPVVRHVDRLSIDAIARECARLAKRAMRGKLDGRDVGGACFTVSVIATPNVESFVALPPPAQTAILALGATRHEAGRPVATMTITYDHALCDGVYVAEFCAALDRALNPEPA